MASDDSGHGRYIVRLWKNSSSFRASRVDGGRDGVKVSAGDHAASDVGAQGRMHDGEVPEHDVREPTALETTTSSVNAATHHGKSARTA